MLCLAIHTYESNKHAPTSVRVPLVVLGTLMKLVPPAAKAQLVQRGVDVEAVLRDAATKVEPCVLIDITDDDDRVVIGIEDMAVQPPQRLPGRV